MSDRNLLSMQMVNGAAQVILNSSTDNILESLSITPAEFDLVTGTKPWIGVDRPLVTRVLDSILFGMIDTIGIPRFELPAEYLATVIVLFVKPVNYFSACAWLGTTVTGGDLAGFNQSLNNEPIEGFEKVPPAQLFALCCDVLGRGVLSKSASQFSKKSTIKLALVQEKGVSNG